MPAQEPFSILLVDNDPMVVRVLNRILHEFTPIRYANSGCEAFKLDPALSQVPIVFITSHENAEIQAKALQLGAADFISKPPQGPVVLARVRTFQRMKALSDSLSETLRNAVTMDFLTGTITRRQFEKVLAQEWLRSNRSAAPLALLLVDIDAFTAYNAEFGEDKGDACLKSVADALRSVAHRPADVLGRYAGG
jgi:PleD family two-component response regulator